MGPSYTTTKGGTERTENKKEQQKLLTPLNYAQRKNQQKSSHPSTSVGNKTEDAKLFSSTPSSQNLPVASEREEQMLPDAMNPSSSSLLPGRLHKGEHAGESVEMSSNIILKQDILAKVKEHEEEIARLRVHLVDYSVKESQILNDKLVLEKRIAHMRMEFDQHQQDFIDGASKALSVRQDIIEENLHLTHRLLAARRTRSTFVSSLMPLLSAHNLQPSVPDAQSIVSNLKVLFTHLQEKLAITEMMQEKQKESHYQIAQRAESSNKTDLEGAEIRTSQEPKLDDGNLSYPYLPTVLEEPSSSFPEAAEDDPLPAIEGLRITGEAFPGRELQASGYSINGTTSCCFEWVRHLEDGSVNYIEGAKEHTYLVTVDDVDSLLAIEVQPLDDRKRKGKIVKVYANEQRKITCDPEMKELTEKILSTGHVSYEVLVPVKFVNMWALALLAINREGYSIKCNGKRGVVITEKFQQNTAINIPYGRPTEFSIQSAEGAEYNLKPAKSSPSRDTIVLILRLYRMKALEKSSGRKKWKKGIFFKQSILQ